MSLNESRQKVEVSELLAEARAIHYAMRNGAISYEKAKNDTKPLLEIINKEIAKIARQFGRNARKVSFQDLGRHI